MSHPEISPEKTWNNGTPTGPNTDGCPSPKLNNGAIRFRCPQCNGKVMTSAKTWRHRHRRTTPNPDIPYVGPIEDRILLQGEQSPSPSKNWTPTNRSPSAHPHGRKSYYSRRVQIENLNNIVKNKGGLKRRMVPRLRPRRPQPRTPRTAGRPQPTTSPKTPAPTTIGRKQRPRTSSPPTPAAAPPKRPFTQRDDNPGASPLAHTVPPQHRQPSAVGFSAPAKPSTRPTGSQPAGHQLGQNTPQKRYKTPPTPMQNHGKTDPDSAPKWSRRKKLQIARSLSSGAGGNRTHDLRVKSPLLCQLSYGPAQQDTTSSGSFPFALAHMQFSNHWPDQAGDWEIWSCRPTHDPIQSRPQSGVAGTRTRWGVCSDDRS